MRKNWLWYQMFRYPLVKFGLHLFYRRIIIEGKENLPKNSPILFVPNHQNSFMDALLVVTHVKPFIYFLTRAQAFNPPLMGKFLRSLNMLPVYRVRDGFSSVNKNKAIFEECIGYMKRNDAILIFAEANHDLKRRIRPLSKGFTRIAFDAEVHENWNMGLQVVPVGLNYTSHRNSRNDVRIVFGEAIEIKEFEGIYKENEREAADQLKAKVAEGMKKTVMHVPNPEHYPVHQILWEELEPDASKFNNPKVVNEHISKARGILSEKEIALGKQLYEKGEEHGISPGKLFIKKNFNWVMILFFPFYLFSFLNNMLPYLPIRNMIRNKIKDHTFDASIKFVLALVLFPFFWTIISLTLWFLGVPGEYVLGYFGLSLFTSILFKEVNLIFQNANKRKHIKAFQKEYPEEYKFMVKGLQTLNEFRVKVLTSTN